VPSRETAGKPGVLAVAYARPDFIEFRTTGVQPLFHLVLSLDALSLPMIARIAAVRQAPGWG